ncbi:helix-turn-helix domain-containing protein [Bacillus suaedae]|uniref:Helix-turn-helix domain-containing protein n=1 Tax=Halalkalibacter suaedae TaxID=2822140 RepID=A0A941ANN7_9BACI|nr:helix-turn-helix domain-containing protein [Bacillus suaedae]MBP3950547.1 helix-turn-helix domain-containing protein [Bacillus suaedae]
MVNSKDVIIVKILDALKGERSIYGAYHLLKGKKSAQTIQDGSFFSILHFFGLFPTIERDEIKSIVEKLAARNVVQWISNDSAVVTEYGRDKLSELVSQYQYLDDLNGWQYHDLANVVWLRIMLCVQTLSHIVHQHNRFYPITHQSQIQLWVKRTLPKENKLQANLFTALYKELHYFLSTCNELQATVFVFQLTGRENIGLTRLQIAELMNKSQDEITLVHLSVIHKLCKETEQQSLYPILSLFAKDLTSTLVLTESASKTLELFQMGYTVEEISQKRKLKVSTIEDHIVEIALLDKNFPIEQFVPNQIAEAIVRSSNVLQTSRLRVIKENVEEDVSYFMIRLVLARRKVNDGT